MNPDRVQEGRYRIVKFDPLSFLLAIISPRRMNGLRLNVKLVMQSRQLHAFRHEINLPSLHSPPAVQGLPMPALAKSRNSIRTETFER